MILVTGGCGYIGAHCVVSLIQNNYNVIVIDNFSNCSPNSSKSIQSILGKNVNIIKCDIRDKELLDKIFKKNCIESVFHFAGLKSISESFVSPLDYYSVNVMGTITLLEVMKKNNVNNLIFSSSATVYNKLDPLPWNEKLKIGLPDNPYAQTKYIVEKLLMNFYESNKSFNAGVLRYFNPIGSHKSGLIGDKIDGSTNLVPTISSYLLNKRSYLPVYGDDYDTFDGSGVRDYIHIDDLIDGHIKALEYIINHKGYHVWNLGSGKGYSVFEMIKMFEKLSNKSFNLKILNKREGDLSEYWADISKAKNELMWYPKNDINKMVSDTLLYLEKSKVKK